MIFKEDYICAGKILKTHGYYGEMVVMLEGFAKGILKKKGPIFVEIDGICVPFFIENIDQGTGKTIIKLNNINNDYDAEEYLGLKLYIRDTNTKTKSKPFGLPELIGFKFHDNTSGIKGDVVAIVDIPENPLLKIDSNGTEYLVPFNNNLIDRINIKKNLLIMNLPEGLID